MVCGSANRIRGDLAKMTRGEFLRSSNMLTRIMTGELKQYSLDIYIRY